MLKLITTHETQAEYLKRGTNAVESLKTLTASGFMECPHDTAMWTSAAAHGQSLAKKFKTLCVMGIGGSSLGPKVIQQMLGPSFQNQILFFENVDPSTFDMKVKQIGAMSEAHWLVISKSGKTLETLSQLKLVTPYFEDSKLQTHFTVVSDPTSNPLTDWAKKFSVPTFSIPLNVGGRYSVLTPVGIIPAAFMGISTEDMRKGAVAATESTGPVALATAQALMSFNKEKWITVFWAYSDLLAPLGAWIQQLWAESLAKRTTRQGKPAPRVSTPLPLIGSNDQHSILQQIMEGARDKFIWFFSVNFLENSGSRLGTPLVGLSEALSERTLGHILRAERLATTQSLRQNGVESLTLEIPDLSAKSLGYLFQFFEMVVASVAEDLDINAFDQPGVELGKKLAQEMLSSSQLFGSY